MSLFEGPAHIELSQEPLAPGATTLRNFIVTEETEILSGFHDVVSGPHGFRMAVAMTKCDALGWVTDRNRLSVTHTARSTPS